MRAASCARLALVAAMASGAGAMKVAVTGASGKTGSLCFKKLYERADTSVVGIVRRKSRKTTKKLCGMAGEKQAAECIYEADVTAPDGLEALLREQSVDALLIATSAVPRIKKTSLLKLMALKLIGKKGGRPSFAWKYGGTPEQVDWLGQKAQLDAAKAAGVKHVVGAAHRDATYRILHAHESRMMPSAQS